MKPFPHALMFPLSLVVVFAFGGCGGGKDSAHANLPERGAVRSSPKIKELMGKLTKGPNSLTPVLGKELNLAQPPWTTIQSQTKDFVRLANELGRNEPAIGSNESWTKLTAAYSGTAAELDRAAQSRQKDTAISALTRLATSCKSCHTAHRVMNADGGSPKSTEGKAGRAAKGAL